MQRHHRRVPPPPPHETGISHESYFNQTVSASAVLAGGCQPLSLTLLLRDSLLAFVYNHIIKTCVMRTRLEISKWNSSVLSLSLQLPRCLPVKGNSAGFFSGGTAVFISDNDEHLRGFEMDLQSALTTLPFSICSSGCFVFSFNWLPSDPVCAFLLIITTVALSKMPFIYELWRLLPSL